VKTGLSDPSDRLSDLLSSKTSFTHHFWNRTTGVKSTGPEQWSAKRLKQPQAISISTAFMVILSEPGIPYNSFVKGIRSNIPQVR